MPCIQFVAPWALLLQTACRIILLIMGDESRKIRERLEREDRKSQSADLVHKNSWFVLLLLVFIAPLGLLMISDTSWSKRLKSFAAIFGIAWICFCLWAISNSSQTPPQAVPAVQPSPMQQTTSNASLDATELPTIAIDKAVLEGDKLLLVTGLAEYTLKVKAKPLFASSGHTLTINGESLKPGTFFVNTYTYKTTLKPGDNNFDIIAKNNKGETHRKLIIRYDVNAQAVLEAEIDGQVAVHPSGIAVTNTSGKVWGQCDLQMNDSLTNRPYVAKLTTLAITGDTSANSPNYIPFSSFSKSTGERFNQGANALKRLTITCYDATGKLGSMSFGEE